MCSSTYQYFEFQAISQVEHMIHGLILPAPIYQKRSHLNKIGTETDLKSWPDTLVC